MNLHSLSFILARLVLILSLSNLPSSAGAQDKLATGKGNGFFSLSAKSNDGEKINFSTYQGKVILAVNVASQCGYTPQYSGLEKLYEKFSGRGFLILGFPSNDFGSQEPGSDAEIKTFCHRNYQVKFPIFSKGVVTGEQKTEIYKYLTNSAPKDQPGEVQWNFEKFLINRQGQVVGRYRSKVEPQDTELVQAIEDQLKVK